MLKAHYSVLTPAVHSSNEGILGGMPTDSVQSLPYLIEQPFTPPTLETSMLNQLDIWTKYLVASDKVHMWTSQAKPII